MKKDKTIIMGGGCPEYNKEIVDYFKRKDIKEADKLLFDTAKNNFEAGKEAQKKEDIEMFEKKLEKLKEWADKNTGCGGDTPYGELLDEIDKIFGEEIK